jgi:hypothetical protein
MPIMKSFSTHIVYIVRLNVILVDLMMQQVKVQLVLAFGVCVEACGVYASAPVKDKLVAVAADEMSNPDLSDVLFQYIRRKVLDHSSRRR